VPIKFSATYWLIASLFIVTVKPRALNPPSTCAIASAVVQWFSFSFALYLATKVVARAWAWVCKTLCFRSFCRAICSGCDIFRVFLGGDGRAATPAAGKTETASETVIV
jgi:hypothetical protein